MFGLRPIPRRVLPHRLEVLDGCEVARVVEHVRVVLERVIDEDDFGPRTVVRGRVYMDARSSEGAFEVPVGVHVMACGVRLQVVGCTACATVGGEVHHWELAVRGAADEFEGR